MKLRRKKWLILNALPLLLIGVWLWIMVADESLQPADDLKPRLSDSPPAGATLVLTSKGSFKNLIAYPNIDITRILSGERGWDASAVGQLLANTSESRRLLDEALAHPVWEFNCDSRRHLQGLCNSLNAEALSRIESSGEGSLSLIEMVLAASVRASLTDFRSSSQTGWDDTRIMDEVFCRAAAAAVRCFDHGGVPEPQLARFQQFLHNLDIPLDAILPAIRLKHWSARSSLTDPANSRRQLAKRSFALWFTCKPVASANFVAARTRSLLLMVEDAVRGNPGRLSSLLRRIGQTPPSGPAILRKWLTPNSEGEEKSLLVIDGWTALTSRWLQIAAMRECLLSVVASERFRLRHGRHPESLHDLVPVFLDRPRIDPWSGGPLEFRKSERLICSTGTRRSSDPFPVLRKSRYAGVQYARHPTEPEVCFIVYTALPPVAAPRFLVSSLETLTFFQ